MGKKTILTYDVSWDEFVADMEKEPNKCWKYPESVEGDEGFTGSKNFDEEKQHMVCGWDKGRDAMAADVEFAKGKEDTFKRETWEYSVAGQRACIPSYCAGVPAHMVYMDDQSERNAVPIVKIWVDVAASWNVSAEAMIRKGAAVVALVDQIESSGQRVELVAKAYTDMQDNEILDVRVMVKAAEEQLDMDRLAYAVAHPSMLRRSLFRVTEFMMHRRVSGYGRVRSDIKVPANTMYIKPMLDDDGYRTMDEALETVRRHWDRMAARGESSDAA